MHVNLTFSADPNEETLRIDSPEGEIAVLVNVFSNGDVEVDAFRYGEDQHEISQLIVGKPAVGTASSQ